MSDELLEVLKNHRLREALPKLPKLNTPENAELLSRQLTELIIKHLRDKTKLHTYSKFITHLCRQHSRRQCVTKKNVQIYLKHLPITKTNENDEALHVPSNDLFEDVNLFFYNQADKNSLLQKKRAFINQQTQQSLSEDFYYNAPQIATYLTPFQFECNLWTKKKITEEQRESSVKFVSAIINLNKSEMFPNIVMNIIENIGNYDTLLTCEKDFLKWLLFKEKINAMLIIEKFPFLLEVTLIEVAIGYLEGKIDENQINTELKWLQRHPEIKKKAVDICWTLFKIGKCDPGLLEVLINLINGQ